jgi:hypothetical protein
MSMGECGVWEKRGKEHVTINGQQIVRAIDFLKEVSCTKIWAFKALRSMEL